MILMAGNESAASFGKRIEALALTPLLFVITLGFGWMVWSVFEWRNGRTPSYRLLRLHVVRLSDGQPIRLGRSIVRSGICCLLLLPTIVVCAIVGVCFAFGASAPDDLFSDPRRAPCETPGQGTERINGPFRGPWPLWNSLTNEGIGAGRTMPRRTRRHRVAIDEGKRPPVHTVAVGVPD